MSSWTIDCQARQMFVKAWTNVHSKITRHRVVSPNKHLSDNWTFVISYKIISHFRMYWKNKDNSLDLHLYIFFRHHNMFLERSVMKPTIFTPAEFIAPFSYKCPVDDQLSTNFLSDNSLSENYIWVWTITMSSKTIDCQS